MRTFLLFTAATLCLSAQVTLRPPAFGCQVTATGALRSLYGVPSSVFAEVVTNEVVSASCSSRLTLYQTGDRVVLLSGEERYEFESAEPLLLAAGDGVAAAVSPSTGMMRIWSQGAWAESPEPLPSGVRTLRLTGISLMALVDDRIITINVNTNVQETHLLPFTITSPVAVITPDSIITIVDSTWNRCGPSGCQPLSRAPSGVTSLTVLNQQWLTAHLENGDSLAVRPSATGVESFQLPGEDRL